MEDFWTVIKLKLIDILERRRDYFVKYNPGIIKDSSGREFNLDTSKSIEYYNTLINIVIQEL